MAKKTALAKAANPDVKPLLSQCARAESNGISPRQQRELDALARRAPALLI